MHRRTLAARILHPDYAHDPDLPAAVQAVIWAVTIAAGGFIFQSCLAGMYYGGAR